MANSKRKLGGGTNIVKKISADTICRQNASGGTRKFTRAVTAIARNGHTARAAVCRLDKLGDRLRCASDGETIDMSLAGDGDWLAWHVEDGAAVADYYVMTIQDDGRLCVEEDGAQMLFVRGEQSADISVPAVQPDTEAVVPSGAAVMTEVRYVCVNADVHGYTVDASMLGGEYAVVLHEGGAADFVIVGAAVPGMTWTRTESGGFLIDY